MRNKYNVRSSIYAFLFSICLIISLEPFAQKKIVVLGSSTAAGGGASNYSNSWVGKLTTYLQSLNPQNIVINLGVGGYTTGSVMPTGCGCGEVSTNNITQAFTHNPDVIIVNLPSNDASFGVPFATTMARFRLLRDLSISRGIEFWLTTSQGRNESQSIRQVLIDTRDSIIAQFPNRFIDFWTTVVNPDGTINNTYNVDGIHVNDLAHEIYFQRSKIAISSLILPVDYELFQANKQMGAVELQWKYNNIDVKRFEVEKSIDGNTYHTIGTISPGSNIYKFLDRSPFQLNYYRIKAVTTNFVKYSQTIKISTNRESSVISIYPNPTFNRTINIKITNLPAENFEVSVSNSIGGKVYQESLSLNGGTSIQTVQLPETLSSGLYYLTMINNKGLKYIQSILLK